MNGDSRASALASLKSNFKDFFPASRRTELSRSAALPLWKDLRDSAEPSFQAFIQEETSIVAFVFLGQITPQGAVRVDLRRPVRQSEERFARSLTWLFNQDLQNTENLLDERWAALEQTRPRRAIAHAISSGPEKMARMSAWIRAMENSMALTYESRTVRHCLVLSRDFQRLTERAGIKLIPMRTGLPLEQALLSEKWIRAVVDGSRLALVANRNTGKIEAFLSLAELNPDNAEQRYAPHWRLASLQSALTSLRDIALVASPHGDIFILTGKGSVFQKAQGRWQLLEYEGLHTLLSTHTRLGEQVVISVLRAILDLSYERTGALFCLLDSPLSIKELVPDHQSPKRANRNLRSSLKGKNICDWTQRQVITAAAAMDGGVVLDSQGNVIDIACMFVAPTEAAEQEAKASREPGARAQAAWRASFKGVAIKVSEDGPITVYKDGRVIGRLG
jgi:DNA integrity scanning protein DisA with diadenylate cyclase activity